MKTLPLLLSLVFLIQLGHSSKIETRLALVKGLLESRTDSALILLQNGFIESKPFGENPFTPYEVVAVNVISGNYAFALNLDTLNYYKSSMYKDLISVPRDGLYLNIEKLMKNYLHSNTHKSKLDSLNQNDRTFLMGFLMSMDSVSQSEINEFIEMNAEYITNKKQRSYLITNLWYKQEPSVWKFYFDFGGGADKFINGAEDILHSTGHMDFGMRLCIYQICPEYEMQIINAKSKIDIEQNDYTFPKESGPQMIMSKINLGYKTFQTSRFENVVYAGFAMTPFNVAEKQKKDYDVEKDMKGFSIGYNIGTSFDVYLRPTQTGNNEYSSGGLRGRFGYIQINEKKIMGLKGGDLYWSLQLVVNIFKMKDAKFK